MSRTFVLDSGDWQQDSAVRGMARHVCLSLVNLYYWTAYSSAALSIRLPVPSNSVGILRAALENPQPDLDALGRGLRRTGSTMQ
eukprot:4048609-Amphidinium_carterae.1